MNSAVEISLFNFALVYLLLVGVALIMRKSKIEKTKLLMFASFRMSIQLVLAGYVLIYLIENPSPFLVIAYIFIMAIFALHRILSVNKGLHKKVKYILFISLFTSAFFILFFFIVLITRQSIFNPQYVIPISGMIFGNAMTAISLAMKTFTNTLQDNRLQMEVLLNQGASAKSILLPFANRALETALLPTINSMLGMGIVSLPGMMSGQILSGEPINSAILYQIAITICISAVVCLSVFLSLRFTYKTYYNKQNQFTF